MKIRREEKVVTIGDAEGGAFIDCASDAVVRAVVYCDDGVGAIDRRVPTRDRPVFAYEDESSRLRISIFRDFEEGGAVEHNPGWVAAPLVPRARRNRNGERILAPGLIIQSGNT